MNAMYFTWGKVDGMKHLIMKDQLIEYGIKH